MSVFVFIICGLFIYYLVYCIKNPQEQHMLGRGWSYNNKPQLSEMGKDFFKMQCKIGIIVTVIFMLCIVAVWIKD